MEHLLLEHFTVETIIGALALIGIIVLALSKRGLIHFGKLINGTGDSMDKKNGGNAKKCPAHFDLVKRLEVLHDNQIKNIQLHEQHSGDLKAGKEEFKATQIEFNKIRADLNNLRVGIAVLLDRTGGPSKAFDDKGRVEV